MSNTRANAMLVVMPLVVLMVCYPIWGRLISKLAKKILFITRLLIVHGGAAWIFVTRDRWVSDC